MDSLTNHAWFSLEAAMRNGVSVYRTPGGSIVGVTRTGCPGQGPRDERYVAEVVRAEYGGCVLPRLWGSYQSARSAQKKAYLTLMNWSLFSTNARHTWN
jgi:hypothetical protein